MKLIAITRQVSPAVNRCELGFLPRQEIDVAKAARQHHRYEECLRELGVTVVCLPAEPELPDSMFVEDPAVVTAEVAVMTRMGAESRRRETETLAPVLARYRPLRWIHAPATLEGGDVLRVGRGIFAGLSARTNQAGVEQLAVELGPLGYRVTPVAVRGCLHLKSAVCYLGGETVLANTNWFDTGVLKGLRVVEVPPEEPHAANVLAVGNNVLVSSAFPRTADLLSTGGWDVRMLDISELMKAEAGLTCSSILLDAAIG